MDHAAEQEQERALGAIFGALIGDALLETLDGTPPRGGRHTDAAMCDVWHGRHTGLSWGGGPLRRYCLSAEAAMGAPVMVPPVGRIRPSACRG